MKRKHTVKIAGIALTGVLLLAGCGGGGSPVAVSNPSQDVVSKKTTATESASSAEMDALLGLRQELLDMPDTAFVSKNADNWDSRDPRQHEKELLNIINRALEAVNADDMSKAAQLLEKQFIPRVDGCETGKIDNDFIGDCSIAAELKAAAEEIIDTINSLNGAAKNGKRSSAAVDWNTFKNSVIAKLNDIKPVITASPDASFVLPPGNSRLQLIGIVDDAIALMEAGDIDGAKDVMENTFYPLTDGGEGGDPTDDLYTAWYYTTVDYTDTMTLVHSMLSEVSITQVTITPGTGRILAGTQLSFTATCTYSGQYDEDCTATAAWTTGDASVGTVSAGTFTGVGGGETTVTATVLGVASNNATVTVLSGTSLQDAFDGSYLEPGKWSDVYTNSSADLIMNGGKLVMSGDSMEYAQIIPTRAYKIDYLEKLEFEVELDLGSSAGMYHVQGIGMMEGNRTGMAVGLMDGTAVGGSPILYYSSLSDYGTLPGARSMKVKVEYYAGRATIYLNGSTTPSAAFNAYVDGTYAVFFLYSSAIYSTFDVSFDNFWTNQEEPGDMGITIENLTNPFAADGSGALHAGDVVKLSMRALPYQKTVEARLSFADTMATAVGSRSLTEVSPGHYETSFVMPAVSGEVVAYGTMDLYQTTRVISRRIQTAGSAGRVLAKTTAATETVADELTPERPVPDFLLPKEFRNK